MTCTRVFPILALAVLAAGCGPGSSRPVGSPAGLRGPAKPAEAVLLRYKFAKDQVLRYDYRLTLSSDGEVWADEKLRAVIQQLCLGPLDNPGGSGGLYMLNIVREETERTKRTKDVDGKEQPVIRLVRNVEPDLSTAYGYDRERNRNYFPCDERGSFGLTAKARFHRVTYDSLAYLLPVLPAEPVAAGSAWTAELPVYAGTDYIYGQGDFPGGSQFPLKLTGRVEKVYTREGSVLAQLTWKAEGTFDSQFYAERFSPAFHTRQRLIHEVKATGRATFDVKSGTITAKDGQATVVFTSMFRIARDRGEPKWEKTVTRHRLSYDCKLLPEGPAAAAPARP